MVLVAPPGTQQVVQHLDTKANKPISYHRLWIALYPPLSDSKDHTALYHYDLRFLSIVYLCKSYAYLISASFSQSRKNKKNSLVKFFNVTEFLELN